MSAPLAYDLTPGFDPTGYPTISGSQLYQLISGIVPNADAGLIKVTTDVAGVPEVPDAVTTAKWQNYIWIRIQAASVAAYVWNPNAATHVTYLKWQTMVEASIADLSITTAKLAAGAVTDDKVTSVSVGKITGLAGTYIPSGSAAGGDLTGTYPNPTIAANAVTSSKLSSSASVDASRAVGTDHVKDDAITEPKIAANAVESAQIKDLNVTFAKLAAAALYDATTATPVVGDYVPFSDISDSNNTKKVTIANLIAMWRTATLYTSAETALSTGAVLLDTAHSLGGTPSYVRAVLVCKTTDVGYAVNDEVDVLCFSNANNEQCFSVQANATNVCVVQTNNGTIEAIKKSATIGSGAAITAGSWRLKVYARL